MSPDKYCKSTFRRFSQFINSYFISTLLMLAALAITVPLIGEAQNSITVKQIELPKPFDQAEVKTMMADNDGFLWFVTNQGIWRFDGSDVQPVDVHDAALPQNSVIQDIYHYHNFLFFNYITWNGISSMFYYDIKKKQLIKYNIRGRLSQFTISSKGSLVFITSEGDRWVFTDRDGLRLTDQFNTYRGWLKGAQIDNYTNDLNGDTYIFADRRVGLIKKNSVVWSKAIDSLKKFSYVSRAYCTAKNIVAVFENGVAVFDKKNLKILIARKSDTSFDFNISLPSKNSIMPVTGYIRDLRVEHLCNIPGSNKMLAGTAKGIFEMRPSEAMPGEAAQQQHIIDFFKNKSIRCIYRSANNKIYIGTYQGLYVYDGHLFKEITNQIAYTFEPVSKTMLLAGLEGSEGFYILNTLTDRGHLNPHSSGMQTTKILKHGDIYFTGAFNSIYNIAALSNGDYKVKQWLNDEKIGTVKDLLFLNKQLWITSTTGLFKVTKFGHAQKVYPIGRALGCYSMQADNDSLWIGTDGEGLIKINARGELIREIHFANGLAGEYVYSLFLLNNLMIAGTNGGVSIFDQAAGMQPLSIPDAPLSDGSLTQEFNYSAVYNDSSKHQVILGGTQGLAYLDADYFKSVSETPNSRIRLSYVKKGYNTNQPTTVDIFASIKDTIEILPGNTYTGVKFSGPASQKYMLFRIRELDSKWHQGKLSDEVSLYAIPPGKYRLEARFPSVTDPRYWLHENLIVVPRFYETQLFKLFIIILLIACGYWAWKYNANKIKYEHQMRTKIASDLHDEIGSALTRISLSSELMSIEKKMDNEALERISTDSKNAITSISDIIWSVDARNDNRENLVLRMKEHAYNMLEDMADVSFEVSGLDKVITLPQLVRQNLYLIFKEAINNIARHNYNPKVSIAFNNQLSGMTITIKNTINRKSKPAFVGQGLRNIQMRAKRMKATADILDAEGIFSIIIKMKRW
jgi:ligand-binding sensor domain-containing protein